MKTITKTQKETLKEMKGEGMYYNGDAVCVEYPYYWKGGQKVKASQTEWADIYAQYWEDPMNEGYWLTKEAKEEFTPEYCKALLEVSL